MPPEHTEPTSKIWPRSPNKKRTSKKGLSGQKSQRLGYEPGPHDLEPFTATGRLSLGGSYCDGNELNSVQNNDLLQVPTVFRAQVQPTAFCPYQIAG